MHPLCTTPTCTPQVVTGIQQNVMAIAKHYILNNQVWTKEG